MAFLTYNELVTEAPKSFLDIVTGTEPEVVDEIILDQMDLIKTNLGSYYDMDEVFAKEGAERNRTVLSYLKDLVFYKLLKRRKPGVLDNSGYDEAMKWLEDISSGKRKADLPPKMVDIDGDGEPDEAIPFMKLGSRKSYKNHW